MYNSERPNNSNFKTKKDWLRMLEQFDDDDFVELIGYEDEIIQDFDRFALSHDVAVRQEATRRTKLLFNKMNQVRTSTRYTNEENRKKKWNQLYESWLFWEEKRINHSY